MHVPVALTMSLLYAGATLAARADGDVDAERALAKYQAQYNKCLEESHAGVAGNYGDMQLARVNCGLDADMAARRDLYVAFRQIERRFGDDAEGRAELLRGQRAWIEYRNAHCSSKERLEGAQLVQLFCNMELDARRAAELSELLP